MSKTNEFFKPKNSGSEIELAFEKNLIESPVIKKQAQVENADYFLRVAADLLTESKLYTEAEEVSNLRAGSLRANAGAFPMIKLKEEDRNKILASKLLREKKILVQEQEELAFVLKKKIKETEDLEKSLSLVSKEINDINKRLKKLI